MHGVTEFFPQLSVRLLDNGNFRLEDSSDPEVAVVDLHPVHVRRLAERLGFVREVSAPDADTKTLAELARDVDRLQRNLLRVRETALKLQKEFATADWAHADLSYEMQQINALVGLLDMATDDFSDNYTAVDPDTGAVMSRTSHATTVTTPSDDGDRNPTPPATAKALPEGLPKAIVPSGTQKELELPT